MKNIIPKDYTDLEFEITVFSENVVTTSPPESKVNTFDFNSLFGLSGENENSPIH